MMPGQDRFELRRLSDGLVYCFARGIGPDGRPAYRRQDQDLWITWRPDWGWVAWDAVSGTCMGRPWDVLPAQQSGAPPEGIWVSRKGARSHVYALVYVADDRTGAADAADVSVPAPGDP